MSFVLNQIRDYFTEVSLGNVPGRMVFNLICKNPNTGLTFVDTWGENVNMSYPTAAEAWEIISDNANDTSAGTGARTVLVEWLDDSYNYQSTIVTMNGTTAVAIDTNHFRPINITVVTAGSSESNVGIIRVQVSGGGAVRNYMGPDDGVSYDGHYTVPAGKTALIHQSWSIYGKNESGSTRARSKPSTANAAWVSIAPVPVYQNSMIFNQEIPIRLEAQTDFQLQAFSDTATADVTIIVQIEEVDN